MPVVAQGVALLALTAVSQMLLRELTRRALRLPASLVGRALPVRKKGQQMPVKKGDEQPEAVYAFRETVLLKRFTLRR